jgi:hypothetical protein
LTITAEVIDAPNRRWLAEGMTSSSREPESRYDRTLRTVMWMDAFLSVAMVVIGVIASPVVATLGVPGGFLFAVAFATIASALLLASFGVITAVLIMLRLRTGQYFLPVNLRLPLPPGMRPAPATFHTGRVIVRSGT